MQNFRREPMFRTFNSDRARFADVNEAMAVLRGVLALAG
jgi:hypothetical protein